MTFCEMYKAGGGCPGCPNRYVCPNSTLKNSSVIAEASITIKELQDAINRRLEQFDGRRYDSRNTPGAPPYHSWYEVAVAEELEERGITIFSPTTWRIVAEIDGPGPIKVSYKDVAKVEADIKRDKRYSHSGPGVILSIRVYFREDLLGLTISAARVRLLEDEKSSAIEYYRAEREKAISEAEAAEKKIAELEAEKIEEVIL